MKRENEILKLFLDATDTFYLDERLEMQKVYLIQKLGYDLGYRFCWYLTRPFCSEIVDILSEIDRNRQKYDNLQINLKQEIYEDIKNKFKKINEEKPRSLSIMSWYELLSSIIYIADNLIEENDDNIIIQKLLEKKNWHKIEDIRKSLKLSREFKIL